MSTVIFLVVIGESSILAQTSHQSAGIENLQLDTPKSNYVDGEIIPISGHTLQNLVINIFLVDNHGNIENSTQVRGNNTGYFDTSLGIPLHVEGGAWSLFAKSGESNFATQVMVNAHGENPPPFNAPSGFAPLKQFKLGIESRYIQCKTGLQLVIKSEDGSPACVKPDTANILIERGWAKEITSNSSNIMVANQTIPITPSCVSNIQNQYALAGVRGDQLCPVMNFQASGNIVNYTGFYGVYGYATYPGTSNFVLEPGHNGTVTYQIDMGEIRSFDNNPPSNEVNVTNDIEFMHDAGMHNHPGVEVSSSQKSEIIQKNGSAFINITFTASKDAKPGTYWVDLPPNFCAGGEVIIITITDCGK